MILVDTSVWVDYLHRGDPHMMSLLERGLVLAHPFVIGELACGSLADRESVLELLWDLPKAPLAEVEEVMVFIERHALHGRDIGYVDVHLLASTALTQSGRLWTRDTRLDAASHALGYDYVVAASH